MVGTTGPLKVGHFDQGQAGGLRPFVDHLPVGTHGVGYLASAAKQLRFGMGQTGSNGYLKFIGVASIHFRSPLDGVRETASKQMADLHGTKQPFGWQSWGITQPPEREQAMNAPDDALEAMRRQGERQQLEVQGMQHAVIEQMWLELARALAEQGVLNAEALAQRLEEHAARAQDSPVWFYGLRGAAQLLRQPSSDPDNLVQ